MLLVLYRKNLVNENTVKIHDFLSVKYLIQDIIRFIFLDR